MATNIDSQETCEHTRKVDKRNEKELRDQIDKFYCRFRWSNVTYETKSITFSCNTCESA